MAEEHGVQLDPTVKDLDAVIIGAGFAGMYMLYKLRQQGVKTRVLETGDGVGGTWFWNRYPGARCDVESMFYSYSFSDELQQEWEWTERYPSQPEILRYANFVADRFDLRRDIQLETRVKSAEYDEAANLWRIETGDGATLTAQFCITAVGCLSAARIPDFPGIESFAGETYHTGYWPQEGVDLTGKRVGIIGTGSSAIQAIPVVAEQADQLVVFQRTANFSVPAKNHPLEPGVQAEVKAHYYELRQNARHTPGGVLWPINDKSALEVSEEERIKQFSRRWKAGGAEFVASFNDLMSSVEANTTAADFVRAKIRKTVRDPRVAELLSPNNHPIGTKRICVDTDYYATYNRDNVTLVSVAQNPIDVITPNGLRTGGVEYDFDVLIFATGFDAMTGPLTRFAIRGKGGQSLNDKWVGGPRAYLGVATAGFPNLFIITGPGSPSVLSNMMVSIEQHVDWIADFISYMRSESIDRMEPTIAAEDAWVEHVNKVANMTLYPQANSWYMGANIPGKPRVFMPYVGGVGAYRELCDGIASRNYEGFELGPSVDPPARIGTGLNAERLAVLVDVGDVGQVRP